MDKFLSSRPLCSLEKNCEFLTDYRHFQKPFIPILLIKHCSEILRHGIKCKKARKSPWMDKNTKRALLRRTGRDLNVLYCIKKGKT